MKKILLIFLLPLLVAGVLIGYLLFKDSQDKKAEQNQLTENNLVGGDRDEHGCIGSAGYSWCALKEKCLRIWEENCDEKLAAEMKDLFVKKYPQNTAAITITIGLSDENHARGSVLFGEPGVGEGGNFLAAKIDGLWQLVFDGNGGIPCTLSKHGFTNEMLSDCY